MLNIVNEQQSARNYVALVLVFGIA